MSARPAKLAWTVVATLLVLVAISFVFPTSHSPSNERKAMARQDARGLIFALRAYKAEYGRFPTVSPDYGADYRKRNAQIMSAPLGKDAAQNSKKIAFYEGRKADTRTRRAGLDPIDGALLDPWGNPYHVRLRGHGHAGARSPYNDEEDSSPLGEVLVWSLGPDGKQGREENPAAFKGSDDIASWR